MSPLLLALLALDMGGAARDLARSVSAAVAPGAAVLTVRNLSSLGPAETAEIRLVFESELHTGGAAEVHLTISQNLTSFLLVAEIRRGSDRQVMLASWPRSVSSTSPGPKDAAQIMLEKKLLWEQPVPILDVAQLPDAMLVLDSDRIVLVRGASRESVPVPAAHIWPRDMRGRLSAAADAFTAWLPGTVCQGQLQPQLSVDCHDSSDPWPLASGLTAALAPARNYFAGRVEIQSWGTRDVPAFYSAAPAGDAWIMAGADGRAHSYSRNWTPGSTIEHWGSDLAGVDTPCGPRILATRAGGPDERDAVQPYAFVDGAASIAGPPLEFPGPVTALWSAGNSATAVSRDLETGRYAAFSLAPACGN